MRTIESRQHEPIDQLAQARKEFDSFLFYAYIGSPAAHAIADCIQGNKAENDVTLFRDRLLTQRFSPIESEIDQEANLLNAESDLRLAENMLNGVRMRIQQRSVEVVGYQESRSRLLPLLASIDTAINQYNIGKGEEDINTTTSYDYAEEQLHLYLSGKLPYFDR